MRERARVLVADDDEDLLLTVTAALEACGLEVMKAENGVQLVEHLIKDGPFDLVVTDLTMPWMTGVTAMDSARHAGLEMPVIVMTAHRNPEIPEQVRSLGGRTTLLHKPFALDALRAAVDTALAAPVDGQAGA